MSKRKEIRVPATTVELVQILGMIIREHLSINLTETECWTFRHINDWEISREPPAEDADEGEWLIYENQGNPIHAMSVYLGSGHCCGYSKLADRAKSSRIDLRVVAEYSSCVATSLSHWTFIIWLKFQDGSSQKYQYRCDLGYGQDRDISVAEDLKIRVQPLDKILSRSE